MTVLHTDKTPDSRARWLLLAVGLLLLTFGLRLHALGDAAFTWDEGYSLWISRLPVPDLLETTARDVHPPLYYLLLRGFGLMAGETEFAARYVSLLLGVLTAAAVWTLGRRVGGLWTGLLAVALLSVARAHIGIAQDARMHMLAMLFVTLGLYAALRWMAQPGRWVWLAAYVAAMLGAAFTFYLALMGVIVTNIAFVLWWWRQGRSLRRLIQWGGAHLLVAAVFVPWGLYTYGLLLRGVSPPPMLPPLVYVQFYFVTLTLGYPTFQEAYVPLYLAMVGVIALGVLLLWRQRRARTVPHLALLLAGVGVPLAVVLAATLPFHSLSRPVAARYFLSLSGAYYVLAAWSVVALGRQRRTWGLLAAGVVFGGALLGLLTETEPRVRRDHFTSIADTLHAQRQATDALVLNNDRTWPTLAAKYDGPRVDMPFANAIDAAVAETLLAPLWTTHEALWLITTPESLVSDPQQALAAWLDARALDSRHWTFNEFGLSVYARTADRAQTLDALDPDYSPPYDAQQPPLPGLSALWQPLTRYQAGDSAHFMLYWDPTAPAQPLDLTLSGPDGLTRDLTLAAAATPRQVWALPLTMDLPVGAYRLHTDAGVALADFAIVDNPLTRLNVMPDTPMAQTLNWTLGDSITLLGYTLDAESLGPGDDVALWVYWQASAPVTPRYKVNAFLLGTAFNPVTGGPLWAQDDSEPYDGAVPTSAWPPGVTLVDRYALRLADDAPPGRYELGLVLYGLRDGARLPVYDADGAALGDMALLQSVSVGGE